MKKQPEIAKKIIKKNKKKHTETKFLLCIFKTRDDDQLYQNKLNANKCVQLRHFDMRIENSLSLSHSFSIVTNTCAKLYFWCLDSGFLVRIQRKLSKIIYGQTYHVCVYNDWRKRWLYTCVCVKFQGKIKRSQISIACSIWCALL